MISVYKTCTGETGVLLGAKVLPLVQTCTCSEWKLAPQSVQVLFTSVLFHLNHSWRNDFALTLLVRFSRTRLLSRPSRLFTTLLPCPIGSGGAMGGGGGRGAIGPPYGFREEEKIEYYVCIFCLSAQRSGIVMIMPLPHYENLLEIFLKSEKKMCRSPPPPPPPLGSRSSSDTFCPP